MVGAFVLAQSRGGEGVSAPGEEISPSSARTTPRSALCVFLQLFLYSITSKAWRSLVPVREGFISVYTGPLRTGRAPGPAVLCQHGKAELGCVLRGSPHSCCVF